jgi:hypothetical protein
MKLIIFVHTCALYEESRAKLIESTWGNTDDVVFITDNPESKLKNNVYLGKYDMRYSYPPFNVYKMFKLFTEKYSDYDWFMIIDDDSYLYIKKLKAYLSYFDKEDSYMIGDFLNWIKYNDKFCYDYTRWVSGGPGIVFSKSTIEKYLDLMCNKVCRVANHDVWLNNLFNISDKSIKRVDCPGFHQYNSPALLKKYSKTSNNLISIHLERKMELMQEFHNIDN